ncbi:transporter, major facilitator family [Legionella spiritensis]|uniref:Transporter, major facilitator family n=2 Tax=Legionella spiritensis TaxID=452 RepID=A0A0W0Z0A7_LEGSP|nr:transporter, major facilitator family [Legionella spiritensis]SNV30589.1 transporter, major facilitator family [Legionella spiritensis]
MHYLELMKYSWSNSVLPIAAIFCFRMLGLFMLIPVFTVFANHLESATPTLIGIALGSYGLSQGILQMPFGILSDKIGRKPVLTIGLLLFILGSLLGALTHSIYGMILARVLQGTGAIGSVLIALMADLTPDRERTKAMAVIGMTIGISFSLAMVISPSITHHYGLPGIFYLTAVLATSGLILLHLVIPSPSRESFHADSETNPSLLKSVFFNPQLQRLNAGIFLQHFILTSTFYVVPLLLSQQVRDGHLSQQWHFYLPVMIFSFLAMIPFIAVAERKQAMKPVFLSSVLIAGLSQWCLAWTHHHQVSLWIFMVTYFIAFNILEASLPSLISKQANPHTKGTAMGIYSSSQFLGIFLGGTAGGLLFQLGGANAIFYTNGLVCVFWLAVAWSMTPYAYLSTIIINGQDFDATTLQIAIRRLSRLKGVSHVRYNREDNHFQLRVIKREYRTGSAENILADIH